MKGLDRTSEQYTYDEPTKTFENMFGREVQKTRAEYIDLWLDNTWQYGTLLNTNEQLAKFREFQNMIRESAGDKWDKSK
jgi:uncharacterized protein YaaR (DUF327 family)